MIPDHAQAGRAVAAAAAQYHADDALAKGRRGGGKERIDGRAGMVDQRTVVEMDASGRQQQHVPVGRRHVDTAGLEDVTFFGEGRRELAVPVQDLGKLAGLTADMHHQGDGRAAIPRQRLGDVAHRLETARRSADRQNRKVNHTVHND